MNTAVATLRPSHDSVMRAWEHFQDLVIAERDNPALRTGIEHCQAVARARQRWETLFLALDNQQ